MKLAWKQIAVAFVLGAVAAFAGVRYLGPHFFHRGAGDRHFQERLLQQFTAKLHSSPDQRAKVAAILEAKRQKIDALRADIRPKFEEIRTSTRTEIRQLLSPEQQQKFDVMDAKFEARAKRFRERFRGVDAGR